MKLKVGKCSLNARGNRSDDLLAIYEFPAAVVCVVADAGGSWTDDAGPGRRACKQAAMSVGRLWKQLTPDATTEVVSRTIRESLVQGDAEFTSFNLRQKSGVTASIVFAVWPRLSDFFVASVGDCRAYLIRGGRLKLLTVDDTLAREMLNSGTISDEDAKTSPFRNVLFKFLGCGRLGRGPEVVSIPIESDDSFLLCTDGLHKFITEEVILAIRRENREVQNCAKALCRKACDAGCRGDASCIVVEFALTKISPIKAAYDSPSDIKP